MYLKNEKPKQNQNKINYVYFFNSQLLTQILFKFSMYMRHTKNEIYQQANNSKKKMII